MSKVTFFRKVHETSNLTPVGDVRDVNLFDDGRVLNLSYLVSSKMILLLNFFAYLAGSKHPSSPNNTKFHWPAYELLLHQSLLED